MPVERLLQEAIDAVPQGRAPVVLQALVQAWTHKPLAALGSLVPRVPLPVAPFQGDTDAWAEAARKASVDERGALLATLLTGGLAEVRRKLEAVSSWRDPRLSAALEAALTEPPWSSNTSRPTWRALFALVSGSGDPRFVALAQTLPAGWTMRSAQKQWLVEAFHEAVGSLPATLEPTAQEAALLATLEGLLALPTPKKSRGPRPDFAAVYAAPADDGPRQVLADALLEQGDPRGDFLSLQLRAKKGKAELAQEKALLKTHAKAWLSVFGPALGAAVKWRRGFPAEGLVKFRDEAAARKYGALAEWATFESLTWSPASSPEHDAAAGFIGPSFRHLKRADQLHLPHLLGTAGVTWALEWVRGSVDTREQLEQLLTSPQLPRLEAVHLRGAFKPEWLTEVTRWGGLKELGLSMPYPPLMLEVLRRAALTSLERLDWGRTLRFWRGADGLFSRLEFLASPRGTYLVHDQLDSLPDGAIEAFVNPPPREWQVRPVAEPLARLLRGAGGAAPDLELAAARHLGLKGAISAVANAAAVLVAGFAAVRVVDPVSLRVRSSITLRSPVLSADGRWVAGVDEDQAPTLVEVATGARRALPVGRSLITALSGDGRRCAWVDEQAHVFELASGQEVYAGPGQSPVLDQTGRRLLLRLNADLVLHDLETGTQRVFPGVLGIASFLSDGRVALPEAASLRLLDEAAGTEEVLPLAKVWRVARSPDGSRLAVLHLANGGPATLDSTRAAWPCARVFRATPRAS